MRIFLVLILLWTNSLVAQDWRSFTASNSLLESNGVTTLSIKDSVKWFYDTDGIYHRFDGPTWEAYKYDTIGGLWIGVPNGIAIQSKDTMWFAHNYYGIYRQTQNPYGWSLVVPGQAFSGDHAFGSICIDSNNNKWCTTIEEGTLIKIDAADVDTEIQNQYPGMENNIFWHSRVDAVGNVWFTADTGLVKTDGNNWTVYPILPGSWGQCFDFDFGLDGKIWMAWTNGLLSIDTFTQVWTHHNESNTDMVHDEEAMAVCVDAGGNVWTCTKESWMYGLYKFDGSSWTRFDSNNGSPIESAGEIEADSFGNVWFTSAGLHVYNPNGLTGPVSVDERSKEHILDVWPNPTNTLINIRSELDQIERIEIFNARGALIKSLSPQSKSHRLDVSAFGNGAYLVKCYSSDKVEVQKFIKQ